jgi:hypothetical protein
VIDDFVSKIQRGIISVDEMQYVFDDVNQVPEELRLKAVAMLMRDSPQEIRKYFNYLKPDKIAIAIRENKVEPDLIQLSVRAYPSSESIRDCALNCPRTLTKTMLMLANQANANQINMLLRNEIQLIMAPELISTLLARKDLDDLLREKLEEMQHKIKRDSQFQMRREFRPENWSTKDRALLISEEESTETEEKKGSIYAMIASMNIAEKMMLAIRANRMTRMLLIKDPNPIVYKAVMRSPKISENDVEVISRNRDMDEEILRIISENARWMRKYAIMRNVAFNPKSPAQLAMNLLPKLANADIRLATRDHNLSHVTKQAVLKIAKLKGIK